ncbi:MAG: hypothetical protein PHG16_10120 [Lachnospiraceae bacterium]|nr:hypothetical protein [Lachnospiraceae bacterium]
MGCKDKKEQMLLRSELKDWEEEHIMLTINGARSSTEDIVHAYAVAEQGTYMRDYIENDGVIHQVDFIYVKD